MDSSLLESGSGSFTDASPSFTPSLTPIPASLSTAAATAALTATTGTATSSTFRAASVTGPAIYYLGESFPSSSPSSLIYRTLLLFFLLPLYYNTAPALLYLCNFDISSQQIFRFLSLPLSVSSLPLSIFHVRLTTF